MQDNLSRVPALAKGQFNRRLRSIKQRMEAEIVASEPGAPIYPFVWSLNAAANERARRYYFGVILKGKKKGRGRYKRTGRILAGFEVKVNVTDEGGLLAVTNDEPGADYVMGDRQIYGHKRTGWPIIDEIAHRYSVIATDELISDWFVLTDPFAGIPQT